MVEGFDKEMDSLLRQTAQSETVFGANSDSKFQIVDSKHLDSDEISAFAENALPEKTRQNYILHLADCEHCRKNLSSLIALNADTQSENIHAESPKLLTATTEKIPWYRKFFAVPTLAYAMGALVLLFAGIGVYTVLQKDSLNSQVSQISEKQSGGGKGMASDGEVRTQETYSNSMSNSARASNQMSTNSAANLPSSAATNSPAQVSANTNTATTLRRESVQSPTDDSKMGEPLVAENKPAETKNSAVAGAPLPAPPPPPPITVADQDKEKQPQPTPNLEAQDVTKAKPEMSARQMPAPSGKLRKADKTEEPKKKSEAYSDTTTIGGKSFKRANNIWVDSAYRGQATTNISRGTKEYKKLDSGLRGIVENLGGTVVIVWKEKTYRVQ